MRVAISPGRAMLVVGFGLFVVAGCQGDKPEPSGGKAEIVSLAKDILPMFVRSCGACHKREGGIAHAIENGTFYETKADILGRVGTHIVAGKPDESGLIKVLDQSVTVGDHNVPMPPPESGVPKFSAEDMELFKKWIAEGAEDN